MTYATKGWTVTLRITESAPVVAGTADFTLPYWVVAGTPAAEKTAAEKNALAQCVNMVSASGRSTVILSSAATGVTRT